MGFWSTMGDLAGSAMKKAAELGREVKAREVDFIGHSDDELINAYKSSRNLVDRTAINNVFRQRTGMHISQVLREGKK